MNQPNIPGPDDTLISLRPLIPHVFHALEAGVEAARTFFDESQHKPDPYLFPCLVRYHAKLQLQSREQAAEYDLDSLANNGLFLAFGGHSIRILKSDDGKLPVPGWSRIKQEFYSQQLSFAFMTGESKPSDARLNLVILWDLDPLWNLEKLTLVCPKAGGLTRESVEVYWEVQLPHPALLETAEVPLVETEDLPITLKKAIPDKARKNG